MSQHFAKIESSKRLQAALKVLNDGLWHSSLEISNGGENLATGSTISELRGNGYTIETRYKRRTSAGKRIFEYRITVRPEPERKEQEPVRLEIKEQEDFFKTDYSGQAVTK